METTTLNHFKKLFLDLKKSHLMSDLALQEDFDGLSKGDEVDHVTTEREQQLLLKLKGRQNFFLKKVDLALERIENGTFGSCIECDADIEVSRLYARPTANLCINCKEDQERGENHIPYQKKSHTLGKTFSNSNIIDIPLKEEPIVSRNDNTAVLRFNRENIGLKH